MTMKPSEWIDFSAKTDDGRDLFVQAVHYVGSERNPSLAYVVLEVRLGPDVSNLVTNAHDERP